MESAAKFLTNVRRLLQEASEEENEKEERASGFSAEERKKRRERRRERCAQAIDKEIKKLRGQAQEDAPETNVEEVGTTANK